MGVFSDLKPKNRAVRNGFDRSQRSVFSLPVGKIVPCLSLATLPSSEYEIDLKQLLRTQPLQTAAFTGFSVNYDFMFLPYNYCYQSFNQFIAQRANKQSSVQPTMQYVPTFNLGYFIYSVLHHAIYDYGMSQVSFDTFAKRVSDIWSVWYDGDDQSLPVDGIPRFILKDKHSPNDSVLLNIIRSMDMLGYGNYLPLLKQYSVLVNQMMHDTLQDEPYSDRALVIIQAGLLRPDSELWEHLAFYWAFNFINTSATHKLSLYDGLLGFCSRVDNFTNEYCQDVYNLTCENFLQVNLAQSPTLWPALAYQKFFHEYYRNTYYDLEETLYFFNSTFNQGYSELIIPYVNLFNLDDEPDFGTPSLIGGGSDRDAFLRLAAIFNLYPHLYRRDLLTAVLPSQQFGDVSVMVTDDNFSQLIAKVNRGSTQNSALTTSANNVIDNNVLVDSSRAYFKFDPGLAISVLESRRADAMQRFKERMLRAGDRVDDIFEAHGWSQPYSEKMYDPVFLGSYDGRLEINTVAATAESDNFEVGQLGANGVCVVNGSKIRFKCSDFGVLMCLAYIVKDSEVDAFQLDRSLQLTEAFDFPYPEFQNISLDAVTRSQAVNFKYAESDAPSLDVVGYLPRYMEYKTALDKVHGEFYSSAPVSVKRVDGVNPIYPYNKPLVPLGVFSNWVTPRRDLLECKELSFLYQQIDVADNVFKMVASPLQETDPFLINAYFDIKAIQPLTVIGLPI